MYRCSDAALVRAARYAELALPEWPDLTETVPADVERWRGWLGEIWALDAVAEAVEFASPVLARQVQMLCAAPLPDARRLRRTVWSVARYLLRMTGRATPFGLFAGVAPASFGSPLTVRWGEGHRAVARAGSSWLAAVIADLESCPDLLERLQVVTNNMAFVRGGRLVVPYPPRPFDGHRMGPAEVSVRNTPAVQLVVQAARSPIRCDELAGKLAAEFPTASSSKVGRLLADLVERHVLLSSLHAPATSTDALRHLISQLESTHAGEIPSLADLLRRLREIHEALVCHNRAGSITAGRDIRTGVVEKMTTLSATERQPLAMDLRMDCALALPQHVAREAESAASVLAWLTPYPFGTTAWQNYHTRFFERYGIGALVPVLDVVDPDVGLGFPAGYLGAQPEPEAVVSARDQRLLALAQAAAVDGCEEIVLDERLIADLTVGDHTQLRVPPHLELCFQLRAESGHSLERGEFDLAVVGVSRGVGTLTGRALGLLEPPEQEHMAGTVAGLLASDPDTVPVQLSFAPLALGDSHVTRVPELLPTVTSIGEHHAGETVIGLEDLAVGCDSRRLYLASLARGRLAPTVLHALDLRAHAPPLARFLTEVGKAQTAVVAAFDWGAASCLPFLPRVRSGRTILAPARWLLDRSALPGPEVAWPQWHAVFEQWRARRRLPSLVCLPERDQRLTLDLDEAAHLALLRSHLGSAGHAVLTEAPERSAHGWFGGRAHEIVVPMTAAQAPRGPAVPAVSASRVVERDHGRLPGASEVLYAKLYGHPARQPEIVAGYLPGLLDQWDEPPVWWYLRYRDPQSHLRLRIALADAREFGPAAHRVSVWAADLRRQGLVRDVQFATSYPEVGRWGSGPLWAAAEQVFSADSHALVVQFAQPAGPHPQALTAANFVAIAVAFTGSPETGTNWLTAHGKIGAATPLPRPVLAEAVRLADPTGNWAALRAVPGGQAITQAWEVRHRALVDYRALLTAAEGLDPDAVLDALLHAHHIRAAGIDRDDERTCLRLAHAAARAWAARNTTGR